MPAIRQDTLLEAYRCLMTIYWQDETIPDYALRQSCMEAGVGIKVALGCEQVAVIDQDLAPKPKGPNLNALNADPTN